VSIESGLQLISNQPVIPLACSLRKWWDPIREWLDNFIGRLV
jgi:hypothetical protein